MVMMTLYKSMVRSKLEYCCPVWSPTKVTEIQKIENVQRAFTRKIVGCKDLAYWERLKKLKLISLQRRRERYCIIHIWKILHDQAPNDLGFACETRCESRDTSTEQEHSIVSETRLRSNV